MDHAVALVESYLRVNGYFTVTEYPVIEACRCGAYRTATDLDVLAFRFPGAGCLVPCNSSEQEKHHELQIFAPDPHLGAPGDEADMLIGEVKEGRAELNEAARDPAVLRAVLTRFGCCRPEHVQAVVQSLLEKGHARTHCGHTVRMVAFGSLPPQLGSTKYTVISLRHVQDFLEAYLRDHWDLLCHAQFKDLAFGFEVLLEKARRGLHEHLS
jgi:hypothetical protein